MKQTKEIGRPKGSRNVEKTQIVDLPRCPYCSKTDRTPYRLVNSVNHGGVTAEGRAYTHVISRRTSCMACGRTRIDKFLENQVPEANPGDENEPDSK
jgi:hypothetical protein